MKILAIMAILIRGLKHTPQYTRQEMRHPMSNAPTPATMPKRARQQVVKNLKKKRDDNITRSQQGPRIIGTRIQDRLDPDLVTQLLSIV